MAKFIKCLLLLSVLGVIPVNSVYAAELISQFEVQITINQDTSIKIAETIKYETDEEHHGIYRYIPTEYRADGRVVRAPIKIIKVTDEEGSSLKYSQTAENKNIVLKIGDPETTFTGTKIYRIEYKALDAIKQFPDHDELFWDITGEGWKIPIKEVRARVDSPFALITRTDCFSGTVGQDDGLCQKEFTESEANFTYNEGVNYNQNVTVALGLDKNNQLIFPTTNERWIKQLMANWWILFIFLPFAFMTIYWFLTGRDYVFINPNVFDLDPAKPKQKKPFVNGSRVPFVYEPLKDLTPGEAGALMDEKVDNQDVIAEIIDLARKKFLTITREETKGFLGKKIDYQFHDLGLDRSALPSQQQTLMKGIFKAGKTIKLTSLKGTFYTTMAKAKTEIDDNLAKRKLYVHNPRTSRGLGMALAITINVLVLLIIGSTMAFVQAFSWYFWFGLQALLSIILGYNTTQKTAVGSNLAMQTKGLKRTIGTGKWREEIKEKNLFIEEIFPFAVALGVVKKLAGDMKALNLKPPEYFGETAFTAISFNSLVSDFSAQASANLSYNPASHSASGGSGFSGGSSGGGGGGGGGGSW